MLLYCVNMLLCYYHAVSLSFYTHRFIAFILRGIYVSSA
ncbi:uncharacterized protein METZ01_LOCUS275528 [marine metagenome]|uniref:Uncharacterized protein n=1 Tax=marine metagenome TaxID=408172 RepID=A0A382KCH6_9ZZZZ